MSLKERLHELVLGQAIFWGKPDLARQEAERLGKSTREQMVCQAKAYEAAGQREIVIHSNHERAKEHFQIAYDLRQSIASLN